MPLGREGGAFSAVAENLVQDTAIRPSAPRSTSATSRFVDTPIVRGSALQALRGEDETSILALLGALGRMQLPERDTAGPFLEAPS